MPALERNGACLLWTEVAAEVARLPFENRGRPSGAQSPDATRLSMVCTVNSVQYGSRLSLHSAYISGAIELSK